MSDAQERDWVPARLNRWRSGRDAEALGELLKWQRDRAYAVACRVLGPGADAEDAVQQAFVKLLSRTHGFEGVEEFKVAVYRAVVQCAIDADRARRSRGRLEKVAMNHGAHSQSPSPQSAAEHAETLRMVREEMEGLPPEDRALVTLCCQEGLSLGQASEALSVPRETLRDRLRRALTDLRNRLRKRENACSLLLLLRTIQEDGQAVEAPKGLCRALDAALPGTPCGSIAPAAAAPVAPAAILAESGLVAGMLTAKSAAMAVAAAAIGIGAWFAVARDESPARGTGREANGVAPAKEADVRPTDPAFAGKTRISERSGDAGKGPSMADEKKRLGAGRAAQLMLEAVLDAAGDAAAIVAGNAAAKEQEIAVEEVPPAILAAARSAVAGIEPKEAERKVRGREVSYGIEGSANGKRYDVTISGDARVLEVVEKIPVNDVPEAIKAAAQKAVTGIVLTEAEKETRCEYAFYKLEGKAGRRKYDIRISPEGKVLRAEPERDEDEEKREVEDLLPRPKDDPGAKHKKTDSPENRF